MTGTRPSHYLAVRDLASTALKLAPSVNLCQSLGTSHCWVHGPGSAIRIRGRASLGRSTRSGSTTCVTELLVAGGQLKLFKEIAEAVASNGWVVLRYDKRTCHPDGSPGHTHCSTSNIGRIDLGNLSIEDFVQDAVAALGLVAARPEVSAALGLAVIGHSQGAFPVGPMAAAAVPAVNKLVMLMGPSLPIDQIMLDQISRFSSPAAANEMRPAFAALNSAVAAGSDGANIDTTALGAGAATGVFWTSWLRTTAPAAVGDVLGRLAARGVDIAALNSPADVQVYEAAYEDMQATVRALHQVIALLLAARCQGFWEQPLTCSVLADGRRGLAHIPRPGGVPC